MPQDDKPGLLGSNAGLGAGSGARCWCHACRPVTPLRHGDMRMIVCPDCGNKRCPKANNHGNACTGSNEAGQPGSAYPAVSYSGYARVVGVPEKGKLQWDDEAPNGLG